MLPILSVCTVFHERIYLYLCSLLVVILLHGFNKLYFLVDTFMPSVPFDDETKKNTSLILTVGSAESDRKGYITMFRGIVVLYTFVFSLSFPRRILCILAVDFPFFPRKYAKTYLQGYSLVELFPPCDSDGHRCGSLYRYERYCCFPTHLPDLVFTIGARVTGFGLHTLALYPRFFVFVRVHRSHGLCNVLS